MRIHRLRLARAQCGLLRLGLWWLSVDRCWLARRLIKLGASLGLG